MNGTQRFRTFRVSLIAIALLGGLLASGPTLRGGDWTSSGAPMDPTSPLPRGKEIRILRCQSDSRDPLIREVILRTYRNPLLDWQQDLSTNTAASLIGFAELSFDDIRQKVELVVDIQSAGSQYLIARTPDLNRDYLEELSGGRLRSLVFSFLNSGRYRNVLIVGTPTGAVEVPMRCRTSFAFARLAASP